MHKTAPHNDLRILIQIRLLGLGIGRSPNKEHNHKRLVPARGPPPRKHRLVVAFIDPVLQEGRKHLLEDVRLVLGVDVGDVFEDTFEV